MFEHRRVSRKKCVPRRFSGKLHWKSEEKEERKQKSSRRNNYGDRENCEDLLMMLFPRVDCDTDMQRMDRASSRHTPAMAYLLFMVRHDTIVFNGIVRKSTWLRLFGSCDPRHGDWLCINSDCNYKIVKMIMCFLIALYTRRCFLNRLEYCSVMRRQCVGINQRSSIYMSLGFLDGQRPPLR